MAEFFSAGGVICFILAASAWGTWAVGKCEYPERVFTVAVIFSAATVVSLLGAWISAVVAERMKMKRKG